MVTTRPPVGLSSISVTKRRRPGTIMIGIDIVEVERIGNIYQKHGPLFLEKLLDEQEISELPAERNRYFLRRLSCYIASKEAIYKAYNNADLGWKDIVNGLAYFTPFFE